MTQTGRLMEGKRGLIMGVANERSIAWGIAKAASDHGAQLAYTYQNDALAKRVRPLAEQTGSDLVLQCDVSDGSSLDSVVSAIGESWGGLDFAVHAIA
jgi:enoyl-[acyl-carrier protein] reductase I